MQPEQQYVILTPAGALYAFSNLVPNEQQQTLQSLLPHTTLWNMHDWINEYGKAQLTLFIESGWVECINKPLIAPTQPLDTFLPYVVASLSGHRRAAIGSDDGFCLARIGLSQQEADILCVVATDYWVFLQRQHQRGWKGGGQSISFFSQIDMLMPMTSFVFLWINDTGYWLIIEGEPLLNNRAFVELIWAIKVEGEKFSR